MKTSTIPNPEPHLDFWVQHPALLVGCSLMIGCMSVWASGIWAVYLAWLRKWPFLLLLPLGAWHAFNHHPPHLEKRENCEAYFEIQTLKPHRTPFHTHLLYKGTLHLPEGNAPCCIYTPIHKSADTDYRLRGKLIPRGDAQVLFKPEKWIPVPGTWSLAEWRYQSKESFRRFLEQKLPSNRTAALLGSLITGDVEDRFLRYQFGKLGLQHLLAISGFHFAALLAFCSFFLTYLLPTNLRQVLLLFAITAYFFFVGPAPAVQRSWVAAVLYLIGELAKKRTSGLNLLGMGMIIETLLNPQAGFEIGFQLSFISCGGILLLYPLIENKLRTYLPKRNFFQILHLSTASKQAYFAAHSLRNLLALSASVNLALAPFLLHHFQQFPLLSLIYNLFIPLLISVCLFATLLSLCFAWVPWISTALFWMTDQLTFQTLKCISYPPVSLDYVIGIKNIPSWILPLYLFALFSLCIKLKERDTIAADQGARDVYYRSSKI